MRTAGCFPGAIEQLLKVIQTYSPCVPKRFTKGDSGFLPRPVRNAAETTGLKEPGEIFQSMKISEICGFLLFQDVLAWAARSRFLTTSRHAATRRLHAS